MILFFDTETNSKPLQGIPEWAEGQPRIVQLAAMLTDENGKEINSMSLVIRPDGWIIPEQLTEIHGISQHFAEHVGVPIKSALSAFRFMARPAMRYVAHSVEFDRDRVNAEMTWAGVREKWEVDSQLCFCTKNGMTDVCKIPFPNGARRWGTQSHKWPTLDEAHRHCFGTPVENAHDALADVRACARVFFWMREQGLVK